MNPVNNINSKFYENFLDDENKQHKIHINKPLDKKTAKLFMKSNPPYKYYKIRYSQIFRCNPNTNSSSDKKILMDYGINRLFSKYQNIIKRR